MKSFARRSEPGLATLAPFGEHRDARIEGNGAFGGRRTDRVATVGVGESGVALAGGHAIGP
jgi:hypothetical protein